MKIVAARTRLPAAWNGSVELWAILALSLAAGLRVIIFCAAFPFFGNVDEVAHCDMVLKFSHGHVPRTFESISAETSQYIGRYATIEYLAHAEQWPNRKAPPPPRTLSQGALDIRLAQNESLWKTVTNPESSEPPLYYALAGLWFRFGQWFLPAGGTLLYWIRFLNVLLMGLLVWLAYFTAKLIFPERRFLRLGVPALLAFFPQDAFYSIQNDNLTPLCFGVAFVGLVRLFRDDTLTWKVAVVTGAGLAATGLTKISSLPLLAVAAAAIFIRARQLFGVGKLRAALMPFGWLVTCAAVPLGSLMLWNKLCFGDLTGSAGKIAVLGWTRKAFPYWWVHPIFSAGGLWTFWHELIASFWRGELLWFREPLASRSVDYFYSLSSTLLAAMVISALVMGTAGGTEFQCASMWLAVWCCIASVAFLAGLSLVFDFGSCINPSRVHPYFVSGRLLSGVMIPFSLIYVRGLDVAFGHAKHERIKWLALVSVILIAVVSEIVVDAPVFCSQYNLFHM